MLSSNPRPVYAGVNLLHNPDLLLCVVGVNLLSISVVPLVFTFESIMGQFMSVLQYIVILKSFKGQDSIQRRTNDLGTAINF